MYRWLQSLLHNSIDGEPWPEDEFAEFMTTLMTPGDEDVEECDEGEFDPENN